MAKKKPKPQYSPTLAAVAKTIKVSESSVYGAQRRHDDFPTRRKRGYLLADFERFAERHRLWHHRTNAPGTTTGSSYNDARGRYLEERTARERIAKERELVEQAKELGDLVHASDVRQFFAQTSFTIQTAMSGIGDAVDRALPRDMADDARERVLAAVKRAIDQVYAAVRTLDVKADDGKASN